MSTSITFQATAIADRIAACKDQLVDLYVKSGHQEAADTLIHDLSQISERDCIKIVFIGPYSAGKSTVISALTGRRDIVIDSDIATDTASEYAWSGGVILTDTPGLYTENPEHTQITIETIKEADLLVYCITSDLFNQYTKKDFINWAFEVGYAGKMFLVVNKMSKEYGDYDTLRENYAITLNKSLTPHKITEFAHSFVDAKDYKDGITSDDAELVAISHFEEFIRQLNQFIQQKGHLGKLDTPIQVLKSSIDTMSAQATDDEQYTAFCTLLSNIERKVEQGRSQLLVNAHTAIKRCLKPIVDKGYELSRLVGVEDIDFSEQDMELLVAECCENLSAELCSLMENGVTTLNSDLEGVLQSSSATYFAGAVENTISSKKIVFESKTKKFDRAQFDAVKGVFESITGKTVSLATKGGSSAKFLIKAGEASGSGLHKTITSIGKTFKFKFKPWQAAKIAKNIGNVAKFAGPVINFIGFIVDVKSTMDEAGKANKIREAQMEYRQQFKDVYEELEAQYRAELDGMLSEYARILAELGEKRESVRKLIRTNNEMTLRLSAIRETLTAIQQDVF